MASPHTSTPTHATSAGAERRYGAIAGLLVAAVALAVAHLVAAGIDGRWSPVVAVGSAAIDLSPPALKSFAIGAFGVNDKAVLLVGIVVMTALAAARLGQAAMRRPRAGYQGLLVFTAVGVAAGLSRPGASAAAVVPALAGGIASSAALWALLRTRRSAAEEQTGAADGDGRTEPGPIATPSGPGTVDRRRFIGAGAAIGGIALAAGGLSRVVGSWSRVDASRLALEAPEPASAAAVLPRGVQVDAPGVSPFITPNDTFYRVDTALFTPRMTAENWQMRIHGMVDREIRLDYAQLLARPLIERDITLSCVSNEVGGGYIGNARWIGAPLRDLLEEAGVHPEADQLLSTSTDGFTAGSPTSVIMDGRDAMLAVQMNGEPLPVEHGFPVRIVVPGLYGYVSATKWVVSLELTTFAAAQAYWIPRGWAAQAPIKTASRIDVPRDRATVDPGTVAIAGVAWAQHRGIAKVEVRVDDGAFVEATLAIEDTEDTWRQWLLPWEATSGDHVIAVRATDGDGETQTEDRVPPAPDGATGWHTIRVTVR